MLLSGQNLQDVWGGRSSLFRTRFGADTLSFEYQNDFILEGDPGHPIGTDATIVIVGGSGAGNQEHPDAVQPVDGAVPVFHYTNAQLPAAVAYEDAFEGYKTIFCAFGLEAVNNTSGQNLITRDELFRRILLWFDVVSVPDLSEGRSPSLPAPLTVELWPNPFNPALQVQVNVTEPSLLHAAVFNLLGREVYRWDPVTMAGNATHRFILQEPALSSGVYFLKVRAGNRHVIRKVYLMR